MVVGGERGYHWVLSIVVHFQVGAEVKSVQTCCLYWTGPLNASCRLASHTLGLLSFASTLAVRLQKHLRLGAKHTFTAKLCLSLRFNVILADILTTTAGSCARGLAVNASDRKLLPHLGRRKTSN